jgi:hypothetical protein
MRMKVLGMGVVVDLLHCHSQAERILLEFSNFSGTFLGPFSNSSGRVLGPTVVW